jgi:choline-sulfatase
MSQAKNVIFITSDEMRGDAPGFMGNPDCQTPHLDRFADRSVVFNRHFTVHGKCVPSRISMMTGRYAHTEAIRTVNKTNLLPPDHPDLMKTLRAHGYEIAKFGHNHVWENFEAEVDWHSFTKPEFHDMAQQTHELPPADPNGPEPIDELKTIDYGGRLTGELGGFNDRNRTAQAIKYLTEVRDKSKPFFMYLNIGRPHPKYAVEEPYYSMYDREALTPYPHDLPANATLHLRKQRELRLGHDVSDRMLREIQAVYYGMITSVDDLMGQFFDAVEAEGLFEDTVIIFCSDHGDFAGQYGINEKWDTAMQECIMHVPFVLCAPGLAGGQRVEGLSEHVDIPRTVLELVGIEPDAKWIIHGESLLPILRGERRKEAVFADGGHEEAMRKRFNRPLWNTDPDGRKVLATGGKQRVYGECPDTMARTKMVRTEKWKLVVREVGGDELFDLENDPHEMRNLIDDPDHQHVIPDLQRRMLDWCLRTDTDRPYQEMVGA